MQWMCANSVVHGTLAFPNERTPFHGFNCPFQIALSRIDRLFYLKETIIRTLFVKTHILVR